MLKELRELIGFVLGFLTDVVELIGTSRLSLSPLQSLGRDRALSLQLSGVVGIVIVGIFISTLSDKDVKIDLLTFGAITLIYFTVAAFAIGLAMRLLRNTDPKAPARSASDTQVDATSYVISFNLVALLVFALLRDVLNYFWRSPGIVWPGVVAVAIAGVAILARKDDPVTGLSPRQRAGVIAILVASFFGYAAALARYTG
jgi:hypothetical protein